MCLTRGRKIPKDLNSREFSANFTGIATFIFFPAIPNPASSDPARRLSVLTFNHGKDILKEADNVFSQTKVI